MNDLDERGDVRSSPAGSADMTSAEPSGGQGILVIVGATGTGKSDLSLDAAEQLAAAGIGAEIVNADAMQLYRGMDIGTAKLSVAERRGVPHRMMDVLDVTEDSSVADYQVAARAAITEIHGRGNLPILVGGSGLYVSSVLFDFQFPGRDDAVRARLEAELERGGPGLLHRRLAEIDPAAADSIGASNGRRLVRALEVVEVTGKPVSGTLPDEPVRWRPSALFALELAREELVPRLNARVERMWERGLVSEVEGLIPLGFDRGVTAGRAIGYAQARAQIAGELSREEAVEQTQALTRRYARRQVSWFKRYPRLTWLPAGDTQNASRVVADAVGLMHGD